LLSASARFETFIVFAIAGSSQVQPILRLRLEWVWRDNVHGASSFGIFAGVIHVFLAEIGSLRVAAAPVCSSLVAPIEEVAAEVPGQLHSYLARANMLFRLHYVHS
jgi:hypothetical protein